MNSTLRSLVFWMVLVVVVVLIWNVSTQFQSPDDSMTFSDFLRQVDAGEVQSVELSGNEITGSVAGGNRFRTYAPPQYEGLVNRLVERDVAVTAREATTSPWATLLYSWAPILLIIGFWIFFMRQVQSGGNKALSFGKSRAKLSNNTQKKVTFKDVSGVDEPKDELQEIIEFLIEPTQDLTNPMDLQVLKVQGMFMIKWGIALIGGFVLAIPVLTYQLWKFVAPALYMNERKYLGPLIIFTYLSFLIGMVFSYTVIIPFSLEFFTSVGVDQIENNFSINYYFNFVTWLMIGSGLIFELPVLVFILSIIGLLTPSFMVHYRRHSIIFVLILSAFITPPDPISLILMSIPLWLLYEISIGVSWLVNRKRDR